MRAAVGEVCVKCGGELLLLRSGWRHIDVKQDHEALPSPREHNAPVPMPPTHQCSVAPCDKKAIAGGLCWGHYGRKRRHGDVLATVPLGEGRPFVSAPAMTDAQVAEVRAEVDRHAKQLVGVALMAMWAGQI